MLEDLKYHHFVCVCFEYLASLLIDAL